MNITIYNILNTIKIFHINNRCCVNSLFKFIIDYDNIMNANKFV